MPIIKEGTTQVRITPVRVESRIEENQVTCDVEIEVDVFGLSLKVRRTITFEGVDAEQIRGQVDAPAALEPKIRAALIDEARVPETAVIEALVQSDYEAKVRTDRPVR
ncbi:MAG: hypothetical protein HN396_18685 [Gemmatimonadales bacterium]|jgi:hypothetical protein|nr:hypothetical protein [Gemmatimonadales bacterium]